MNEREECRRDVARLDRDLAQIDEDDHRAFEYADQLRAALSGAHADVGGALHRVRVLEDELSDRATQDERRLQRIAAAEQLRRQIAAVADALQRSEDEYATNLTAAETAVVGAEASVERATAALSDAVRRCAASPRRCPRRSGRAPATTLSASCPACGRRWPPRSTGPRWRWPAPRRTWTGPGATSTRPRPSWTTTSRGADRRHRRRRRAPGVLDLVGTAIPRCARRSPRRPRRPPRPTARPAGGGIREAPVVLLTDDPDTLGWAISLPTT
jgi:hypothetical protein